MSSVAPIHQTPLKSILKHGGKGVESQAITATHSDAYPAETDIPSGRGLACSSPARTRLVLFPLLLLTLSMGLYAETRRAGYVWDDRAAIVSILSRIL